MTGHVKEHCSPPKLGIRRRWRVGMVWRCDCGQFWGVEMYDYAECTRRKWMRIELAAKRTDTRWEPVK